MQYFQKLNRKMHLSKVKHSKFNESGQLMTFYFASAAWGVDTILRVTYDSFIQYSDYMKTECSVSRFIF